MEMEYFEFPSEKAYLEYLLYAINGEPPLTPSRHGKKCLGNGESPYYECCCDNCDYFLRCYPEYGLSVYRNYMKKKWSGKTFKLVIKKK